MRLSIVKSLVGFHGGTVKAEGDGDYRGEVHGLTAVGGAGRLERTDVDAGWIHRWDHQRRVALPHTCAGRRRRIGCGRVRQTIAGNHGAEVAIAASAPEAIDLLTTIPADIVISDIGLPGVDGYQRTERVRQRDTAAGGGIPAVVLTAFARSEDRTRALLAGYQAHLTKPIEPNELVATVASLAELVMTRRANGPDHRE